MNATTMTASVLAVLVLALAACSSTDNAATSNPNIPPTDYRQEIITTLETYFKSNETISVSNAFLSDPELRPGDKEQRYTACVRYTAHGVTPGEVGNAERIAYFYGGHLNQLIPVTGDECARVAYKPFPELNKVCLGKGCDGQRRDKGVFGIGSLFGR
jgi:hypothetical protein